METTAASGSDEEEDADWGDFDAAPAPATAEAGTSGADDASASSTPAAAARAVEATAASDGDDDADWGDFDAAPAKAPNGGNDDDWGDFGAAPSKAPNGGDDDDWGDFDAARPPSTTAADVEETADWGPAPALRSDDDWADFEAAPAPAPAPAPASAPAHAPARSTATAPRPTAAAAAASAPQHGDDWAAFEAATPSQPLLTRAASQDAPEVHRAAAFAASWVADRPPPVPPSSAAIPPSTVLEAVTAGGSLPYVCYAFARCPSPLLFTRGRFFFPDLGVCSLSLASLSFVPVLGLPASAPQPLPAVCLQVAADARVRLQHAYPAPLVAPEPTLALSFPPDSEPAPDTSEDWDGAHDVALCDRPTPSFPARSKPKKTKTALPQVAPLPQVCPPFLFGQLTLVFCCSPLFTSLLLLSAVHGSHRATTCGAATVVSV